jgi:hypothetical protein
MQPSDTIWRDYLLAGIMVTVPFLPLVVRATLDLLRERTAEREADRPESTTSRALTKSAQSSFTRT